MNEQNDKPLHEWVRRSLDNHRPAYEPTDWARMQQALQRRQWWRRGILSGLGLGILLIMVWVAWPTQPTEKPAPPLANKVIPVPAKPRKAQPLVTTKTPALVARTVAKPVSVQHKLRLTSPVEAGWLAVQTPAPITPVRNFTFLSTHLTNPLGQLERVAFSGEESAIARQMLTGDFGPDSTSYRTLDRNLTQWPDAVLICDLTTSMYPYTTQLFAWFRRHRRQPSVKGIVFFTDCDSLGQQTRPGGPPGRMFVTHELSSSHVLPILLKAARNTVRNKDEAENNVEALLFAQRQFSSAKHLILIADNLSTVKDMNRVGQVKKPVHVVLCGTTGSDTAHAFQPDYYTIARQTGGSLHTLEDDLNPAQIALTTTLRVGSRYYRYNARKKRFKLTAFTHRPKRFLKLFWF